MPAAGLAVLVGFAVVMSYAACSGQACPEEGPSGVWLDVLWFGSPVVAALTLVGSIFTARHKRGFVLPVCALALIAVDIGLLALYAQT